MDEFGFRYTFLNSYVNMVFHIYISGHLKQPSLYVRCNVVTNMAPGHA